MKCDIQQVCCDAALTVIEEQNSICKSFRDSSTPIKHDKKVCQKLLCPRKEGGLAPGHQMRRKGTASSWQWAPAATPGRLPSHLNSELQQPLHSVLGSNSCSHCLAVALWDSLGTTGLTVLCHCCAELGMERLNVLKQRAHSPNGRNVSVS